MPSILFISEHLGVINRVPQEMDSEVEFCIQEIDWGVVLGINLEGSERNKIRQRERLNCEVVTQGASAYLGGSLNLGTLFKNI